MCMQDFNNYKDSSEIAAENLHKSFPGANVDELVQSVVARQNQLHDGTPNSSSTPGHN